MIIHAIGGAGTNIGKFVYDQMKDLGEGFADVEIHYMDTSNNNIDKIDHEPEQFTLVREISNAKDKISGSGGERQTHVASIMENVKTYIDDHKFLKYKTGEYHIVIGSASGGSASVIAPMVVKHLASKDIPTVSVVIGDSSNGLNAINTLNTIATYNSIATKVIKKPLSMLYLNNHLFMNSKNNKAAAELEVNDRIYNSLATLSLFLSNQNGDIDLEDMALFIDQSKYKTINIKPGIYCIKSYVSNVTPEENAIPTVARTLTTESYPPDLDITLLHHKTGYILEDNALDVFNKQLPVHLVQYANFLVGEKNALQKIVDNYNDILAAIEISTLDSEGSDEDDTGMVF